MSVWLAVIESGSLGRLEVTGTLRGGLRVGLARALDQTLAFIADVQLAATVEGRTLPPFEMTIRLVPLEGPVSPSSPSPGGGGPIAGE